MVLSCAHNENKKPHQKMELFVLAGVAGFASLEPPAKQSTGLFFAYGNTQLKLLAPNSNPSLFTIKKLTPTK